LDLFREAPILGLHYIERHTETWLFLPISVPALVCSVSWAQHDQRGIASGTYEHFASVWSVYICYLSDHRISLNLLIVTSLLAASTAVLTLWGLALTLASLVIFSLVYGFFGAGYVATVSSFRTGFGWIPSDRFNQAYVGLWRMP
jgi:hypothetical protein